MNVLLKLSLSCILAVILSVLIKKQTPELSLVISLAIVLCCLFVAVDFISQLKESVYKLMNMQYINFQRFEVLIKCLAVSVLTHVSCCVCKDAGQSAAACALEFTGNLALIICVSPLIVSLFQILGELL